MSDTRKKITDYKDFDKWDIQSIREAAIKNFIDLRDMDNVTALVKATLDYLHARGFDVVRNEERPDTASRPGPGWYTAPVKKKNYYE